MKFFYLLKFNQIRQIPNLGLLKDKDNENIIWLIVFVIITISIFLISGLILYCIIRSKCYYPRNNSLKKIKMKSGNVKIINDEEKEFIPKYNSDNED